MQHLDLFPASLHETNISKYYYFRIIINNITVMSNFHFIENDFVFFLIYKNENRGFSYLQKLFRAKFAQNLFFRTSCEP